MDISLTTSLSLQWKISMKILFINPAWDAASCSYRQAAAISKYTGHETHHFRAVKTFYDTLDIGPENYNRDEFVSFIEEADILHFCSATHDYPSEHNWGFNWNDFIPKKIKIFHDYNSFPGYWKTRWLTQDHWNKRQQIGYNAIFSSIPQAKYIYKDCVYVPDLVDEQDEWFMPNTERDLSQVVLCHFPTGGGNNKNTDELLQALRIFSVKSHLMEAAPNRHVLAVKKHSNLGFDCLWRGFHGATTVENLSLGIPTMCNIEPEFDNIFNEYFGIEESPFEKVQTIEDIVSMLKKYQMDNALLRARCEYVRQFMITKWSAKQIAERLIKEYEKL